MQSVYPSEQSINKNGVENLDSEPRSNINFENESKLNKKDQFVRDYEAKLDPNIVKITNRILEEIQERKMKNGNIFCTPTFFL